MLRCQGLGISFGGIAALTDVDLSVQPGEAVGLIGPNGSGKTTLVNVISGYYRPDTGTVMLQGAAIQRRSPQHIRSLGVSRAFQNLRLFPDMTVLENVELAMLRGMGHGGEVIRSTITGIFGRSDRREAVQLRQRAQELLAANSLGHLSQRRVTELSYGQRKEIELVRAVAVPPRLLLLDEPTSGVSDTDAEFFKTRILDWQHQFGFGIVIVEHRLGWLFDIASKLVVLNGGRVIASGSPDEIAADPEVKRAYVGA
jgi:branched-chain amino acid transport system ATP-binding protein